eukprot:2457803-Amphidinium_carterae.1
MWKRQVGKTTPEKLGIPVINNAATTEITVAAKRNSLFSSSGVPLCLPSKSVYNDLCYTGGTIILSHLDVHKHAKDIKIYEPYALARAICKTQHMWNCFL